MTWHNKVVWTEGMFLQPQHFQQHDRYIEYQIRQRLLATIGYGWGFSSVAIDDAALALGKLSLNSAQGILPDGSAFSVPGNDAAAIATATVAKVNSYGPEFALTAGIFKSGSTKNTPTARAKIVPSFMNVLR